MERQGFPSQQSAVDFQTLEAMANRLRRHSLETTARSKSGHPTTCMSSADLVAALFFRYLRFDLKKPKDRRNDRFVLSKGHAAPLLWAVLAEAGAFPVEHLKTLRLIDSDLEGHPTPRNKWVDVATGSLGQGLSVGVGMALSSRLDGIDNKIYVLMGDGEVAEGAVWEAASLASYRNLDNLIGILDVNGLGQSQRTMFGHDTDLYCRRFEAFGWETRAIDGHDMEEIDDALRWALQADGSPRLIVARTFKGAGVSFLSDAEGRHGVPVTDPQELAKAVAELDDDPGRDFGLTIAAPDKGGSAGPQGFARQMEGPGYGPDDKIATRGAYGIGLRKLGAAHPEVVALDGDTKNSTYSQDFLKAYPERFFECYIAEQNMVGAATGFAALGKIPFSSTFAAFLTRAYDQIRMGAVSRANMKICGSHAGASIGEDGPSQMGLEDLAMMRAIAGSTVLYPSDGVCAENCVRLAAEREGIVYIRTTRPKTPLLYPNDEDFWVGGSKVLRSSDNDQATLVAAGITLHESLAAYEDLKKAGIAVRVIDLYSVKPVDGETLRQAARETGVVITVEDHYPAGGLGDAVLDAIANENVRYRKLAVSGLPRSGAPDALLDEFGISRKRIVEAVREFV
ncbi:MAG TPA: transketolase [Acidobacteriota bacterium]|nr:transketolase [Acidobacteriota bacterium]